MVPTEAVYPMAIAERLTGLTRRQIRYYERQGLLSVYRTAGNQRLYTPQDIELLLRIGALLAHGFRTIEAVSHHLAAEPTVAPPAVQPSRARAAPAASLLELSRCSDAASRFTTANRAGPTLRLGQDERQTLRHVPR
jgi:MerR family glutamine synthetase transcriptional repressor